MEHSLKGNWGNRNNDDFLFQIAFDFVAQLEDIMEAEGLDRTKLAAALNVSKGRVSQVLNNPGNLTLKNVVQYTRALKRKVVLVAYEDDDAANSNGPISPQVFVECWQKSGKPADLFDVEAVVAESRETEVAPRWSWSQSTPFRQFTYYESDRIAVTIYTFASDYDLGGNKPSLEDLTYAGTNATQFLP